MIDRVNGSKRWNFVIGDHILTLKRRQIVKASLILIFDYLLPISFSKVECSKCQWFLCDRFFDAWFEETKICLFQSSITDRQKIHHWNIIRTRHVKRTQKGNLWRRKEQQQNCTKFYPETKRPDKGWRKNIRRIKLISIFKLCLNII